MKRGYYLIKGDTRHFLGSSKDQASGSLEPVCNRVLSESTGWDYWIDYCYGLDVRGAEAWSNLDHTDSFI